MIEGSVIGTIGSVKGDLNSCLSEVVGLWGLACGSGRVGDFGLSVGTEGNEVAESRVGNINFSLILSERLEVLTSNLDDVTSLFGTGIWINEGDLWVVVIPELNVVSGLLLTVQRNGEWHTSLDYIRVGGYAGDITSIVNLGWYGFGTKGAHGVVTIFDEAFTPNLNSGSTILWAVSWLDGRNLHWFVVEEVNR
jgi:hypothetical protein